MIGIAGHVGVPLESGNLLHAVVADEIGVEVDFTARVCASADVPAIDVDVVVEGEESCRVRAAGRRLAS